MGTSFQYVSKICAICPLLRGLEFVGRLTRQNLKIPVWADVRYKVFKDPRRNRITDTTVTYGGRSSRAPFLVKVGCGTRITVRKHNGQRNSPRTVLLAKLEFFLIYLKLHFRVTSIHFGKEWKSTQANFKMRSASRIINI